MGYRSRAQRFEIQIPLDYRVDGKSEWHKGTTKNISCTGVLFRGEEFAEPNTPLEMRLVLPDLTSGLRSAAVVCRGVVARSAPPDGADAFALLASTISDYRLIQRKTEG